MACKKLETFESRAPTSSIFTQIVSGSWSISTSAAYDGEVGARGDGEARMSLGAAFSEGWHHFKVRMNASPAGTSRLFRWLSDATVLGSIRVNISSRKVEIYTGTSTLVQTGNLILVPDVWYDFQLRTKIANSGGVIEVKTNGVVDGSAFVGDTQPGSETTFNNVDLQTPSNTTDFDNYWFDDAGYKGIIRIETKRPSANGDDAAWTGSYTDVDDVTPDDNTTVLKSSTNNQEHAVKFPSHSLSGSAVILAVAHEHRPVKETAGDITLGLKEGGTKTYEGAARSLGISYGQLMAIWETNPRTSAAFTVSQLNGDSNAVQAYIKAGGM